MLRCVGVCLKPHEVLHTHTHTHTVLWGDFVTYPFVLNSPPKVVRIIQDAAEIVN